MKDSKMLDELGSSPCSLPMINQWELMVLLDSLHGSLRFVDGGNIWRWSKDQRKGVLDSIYTRMNQLPIGSE